MVIPEMARREKGADMQSDAARNFLPSLPGLLAPPLVLAALYLTRYADLEFYMRWWEGELGVLENLGPLLLLPAIYCGLALARHRKVFPQTWIVIWFLLHGLGALFFAGEEISWGQHFFNWQTPETISALNDQNETNLHNMSSWLDQKPRIALWVWALTGGFFAWLA